MLSVLFKLKTDRKLYPGFVFNQGKDPIKIHVWIESEQPIHSLEWKLGTQEGTIREFEREKNKYHAIVVTDTKNQWKEKLWYKIDDQPPQVTDTYFIYDTKNPRVLLKYDQNYKKEDILYFSTPVSGTIQVDEENFFENVQVYRDGKKINQTIDWEGKTGTFLFEESGRYEIQYTDYSNNEMICKNNIFDIDLLPPKLWIQDNVLYVEERNFNAERFSNPDLKKAKWKQKNSLHFLDLETLYAEGIYNLDISYKSPSGQEGKLKKTIYIDHTPPHSLYVETSKPATAKQNTLYYKDEARIEVSARDEISQVDYFIWEWSNQKEKIKAKENSTATIQLKAEGRGKLKVTAVDHAGNKTILQQEQEIVIDRTPPEVDLQLPTQTNLQQLNGHLSVKETNFDKENIRLYVIKNQQRTPIELYWNQQEADFKIQEEGTCQIYAEYKDNSFNASNIDMYLSKEYKIDVTPPKIYIEPLQVQKAYYNHAIEYKINVQDENAYHLYAIVNGEKQRIQNTLRISQEGHYQIQFQAIDASQNISNLYSVPECTLDTTIVQPEILLPQNVFDQDVKIQINMKDENLLQKDTKIIQIFPDGSMKPRNWKDIQKRTLDNDGRYLVQARIQDQAGNSSSQQKEFIINRFGTQYQFSDSLKEINHKKIKQFNKNLSISWYNPSLTYKKIMVCKDGRPMQNVKWKVEDTKLTIAPENFLQEGVYEIFVFTEDGIRKQENEKIHFCIDHTSPEITKLEGLEKNIYHKSKIKVDYKIFDAFGLQDIQLLVDGKQLAVVDQFTDQNQKEGYWIIPGKNRKQKIQIIATDQAGNQVYKTFEVLISNHFFTILITNPAVWLGILGVLFLLLIKCKKRADIS